MYPRGGGNEMHPKQTISGDDVLYADENEPMVLGDQRTNAYTIANMQAAKDSLDALGYVSENEVNIRVTHKYIKFAPANEEELYELWQDTTITFYDYPMDYYISVYGNFYHDPTLPDSVPTYQYASIKVGQTYNTAITHIILEDLYIPEEDEQLIGAHQDENIFYMLNLYSMAHLLTGNFDMPVFENITPWDPGMGPGGNVLIPISGIIRVNDTRLNQNIALEGVKVESKKNFTTYYGFTNASGAYTLNGAHTSTNNITYTINFERKYFTIQRNKLQKAKIVRTSNGNFWSHTIADGRDRMHGHMFRAAHRYYNKDITGLLNPKITTWKTPIISDDHDRGVSGLAIPIAPLIKIRRFIQGSGNTEYFSDEIFSTTIHEIAHIGHMLTMDNPNHYAWVSGLIQESWCTGVEWWLTRIEYQGLGELNYSNWNYNPTPTPQIQPIRFGYQNWETAVSANTTSLFINLVDDFNEIGQNLRAPTTPAISGSVDDRVTGYNLATIQSNYLKDCYNQSSLSTNLRDNRPTGVTLAQVNLLLGFYF